ncbi:hypothetical protein VNO78_24719 [Psophocarpus tetragonolobus]|uniref:Uncharacterized protein n=1 Tax=Psophocarpus tetragonolobus TaxID=3891 RepID=A0AAN9S5F5_PSOTE
MLMVWTYDAKNSSRPSSLIRWLSFEQRLKGHFRAQMTHLAVAEISFQISFIRSGMQPSRLRNHLFMNHVDPLIQAHVFGSAAVSIEVFWSHILIAPQNQNDMEISAFSNFKDNKFDVPCFIEVSLHRLKSYI